jgi:hypothetical protein
MIAPLDARWRTPSARFSHQCPLCDAMPSDDRYWDPAALRNHLYDRQ